MGMGSASSPASGASVRCCFSASAPAVASSCFLFLGRSAWMASGGFCGHFAHHFAWLGFCPGRKNCGVAAWPHTQNLLTTSTASAGFIGHRWHQRAAFLGSPGRAYIGVPRAPHTHRFFTRTALAGLDGHLMHHLATRRLSPRRPSVGTACPHWQTMLNAVSGLFGQRAHHVTSPGGAANVGRPRRHSHRLLSASITPTGFAGQSRHHLGTESGPGSPKKARPAPHSQLGPSLDSAFSGLSGHCRHQRLSLRGSPGSMKLGFPLPHSQRLT
mmetsp:Transcript_38477/g.98392  ORF Transcript_38477/g.98392 Transcript_38477/m.98392 type:complete len:271 (-) Transcript_38477:771-1583(-)